MSAPPLPEIFGNYALGDFVEVVSPPGVDWWPQTAGWAWLGALVFAYALYRGGRALRRWYRNRYRREAAARLHRLDTHTAGAGFAGEVNRLLKLAALVAFPREDVARLSGDAWVAFLNGHCPAAPFSADQGRLLATAPYRPAALEEYRARALLAASLAWVQLHESPLDV